MSLKVELKPHERLIIGSCVVTNSDQRTRLFIDGSAPILREKDILTADISKLRGEYFELVNDIVTAAPSCIPIVDEINNDILTGALYKALKAAKRLIQYEQDLLTNAAARG